ncbi:MAG: L,D-transpeptidase family protein [Bacteroidales bacterium]|nr:L,D-transpeptidase family protein [Bacteroidales bacterium]
MRNKLLKWIFIIIIIAIAIIVFIVFTWHKPPIEEITLARTNLTKAEMLNSAIYAKSIFNNAKSYYDSAMNHWQTENEKLFFLRNFSRVRMYAIEANKLALLSIEKTNVASHNIKNLLKDQITSLEKQVELYNKFYSNVPLSEIQRNKLIKGKILLKEGILIYRENNFQTASQKIESAETLINEIIFYTNNIYRKYFENYNEWKQWAEKTISNSKKNKTFCIIIDKFSRECILYKNGVLYNRYDIELGQNWIGNKNCQGDKSTPEGFYKIIKKKSSGETKYYKALLLNYPNEDDKERFVWNLKNGQINKEAKIGNLIEIHGYGGKGSDWTDGCIALENESMDILFSVCTIGTEVTILGSLKPLQEILNSN